MNLLKLKLANDILAATAETFDTMMESELLRLTSLPEDADGEDTQKMITAIIGLSGTIALRFVLSVPAATGIRITAKFLETEQEAVNDDVLDALKEVVNIIAGAAAAKASDYDFLLTLPVVLIGNGVNYSNLRGDSLQIPVFITDCGYASIGLSAASVKS